MAGHRKKRQAEADALRAATEAGMSRPPFDVGGWDGLLRRAQMRLDDDGVANEETRRKVAGKKLARLGLEAPPYEMDRIRGALVAYFEDVVVGNPKGWKTVLAEHGTNAADFNDAKVLDADLQTVFEYLKVLQREVESQDLTEMPGKAQRGLSRLLTEEGCELNERAMEFALKTLRRETFGESASDSEGKDKAPTVYQISGVQINNNLIAGDAMAKALPKGGVVDVEEVLKEIGDG